MASLEDAVDLLMGGLKNAAAQLYFLPKQKPEQVEKERFCYTQTFRMSLFSETRLQSTGTKIKSFQGWIFGSNFV